ncbi:PadR family transcriptional regulator, partial [candidate division WOR-3 bacterium]|nr:PadR family transcriptional regulator [candidate division WOR-3 bacterium]
ISFGTLYPIFHKLENKGYLKSKQENVNGKIRKYYSITKKGERILKQSKNKAKELFDELFEQ